MTKPDASLFKDATHATKTSAQAGRRRKHGYRGYPNTRSRGGGIHWGSGFSGAGALSGASGDDGILTERTRDDARRAADARR